MDVREDREGWVRTVATLAMGVGRITIMECGYESHNGLLVSVRLCVW